MKNALAIFARAPVPGHVKTRLAQTLGDENAARLYRAMLRDTIDVAQRAARSVENCEVVLSFTPDEAFDEGEHSLASFWNGARLAQRGDDLGARMLDCIARLQEQGAERVVLIGSDAPDLPEHYLRLTFFRLLKHPTVFGPARDGGFYLFGASVALPYNLFAGIEWSTTSVLGQCVEAVGRVDACAGFLPPWDDVDTPADLLALQERLATVSSAPATAKVMRVKKLIE